MSRKISTNIALAASAIAFALASAAASASSSDFSLTLNDETGFSSLSNGTFSFSSPVPLHISGSVMQRDGNNDGFGDNPLNIVYNQDISLSEGLILLHITPGTGVAFSDSGPLTTTFDWSITMYDDFVTFGAASEVGSPLFGTAEVFADHTLLHINEGLFWAAGLNSPFWGGYILPDISALRLSQNENDAFILETVPVPAPASAALLLALPLTGSRRRK